MNAFWKNLTIRVVATSVLFGMPSLVTVWLTGSLGDVSLYLTAGAFALGGLGSAVITWATTLSGDPTSGTFG